VIVQVLVLCVCVCVFAHVLKRFLTCVCSATHVHMSKGLNEKKRPSHTPPTHTQRQTHTHTRTHAHIWNSGSISRNSHIRTHTPRTAAASPEPHTHAHARTHTHTWNSGSISRNSSIVRLQSKYACHSLRAFGRRLDCAWYWFTVSAISSIFSTTSTQK